MTLSVMLGMKYSASNDAATVKNSPIKMILAPSL
jgi:hypothetical protein